MRRGCKPPVCLSVHLTLPPPPHTPPPPACREEQAPVSGEPSQEGSGRTAQGPCGGQLEWLCTRAEVGVWAAGKIWLKVYLGLWASPSVAFDGPALKGKGPEGCGPQAQAWPGLQACEPWTWNQRARRDRSASLQAPSPRGISGLGSSSELWEAGLGLGQGQRTTREPTRPLHVERCSRESHGQGQPSGPPGPSLLKAAAVDTQPMSREHAHTHRSAWGPAGETRLACGLSPSSKVQIPPTWAEFQQNWFISSA